MRSDPRPPLTASGPSLRHDPHPSPPRHPYWHRPPLYKTAWEESTPPIHDPHRSPNREPQHAVRGMAFRGEAGDLPAQRRDKSDLLMASWFP